MKTRSAAAKAAEPKAVVVVPVLQQTRTNAYKKESLAILKLTFPRVSVDAIRRVFQSHTSFPAAYRILYSINDCITEDNDNERRMRRRILLLAPCLEDTKKIVLKTNRKGSTTNCPTEPTLLAELETIPEMSNKENRPINAKEKVVVEVETKKASEQTLVCACCFDDECLFENMCQCDEGHLVCTECLRHYVEEQLDGKGVGHFQCMDMEAVTKCTAAYSLPQLGRAFSPKSLQKVEEKMFRFDFKKANMDDGCQCPKCSHLFISNVNKKGVDDVSCPECKHDFCRLCEKAPHDSKTCEEAKAAEKENLDAHAKVAAAMNDAVIRNCPNCKKPFMKDRGCNKMTCPCCGTISCYICRQRIKDYSHFCQTALCNHQACGKCILFTNADEDDRRARRQVAQAAVKETEKKEGAAAASLVAGLLLSPPQKTKKTKRRQENGLLPARLPAEPLFLARQNAEPPVARMHGRPRPNEEGFERQQNRRHRERRPPTPPRPRRNPDHPAGRQDNGRLPEPRPVAPLPRSNAEPPVALEHGPQQEPLPLPDDRAEPEENVEQEGGRCTIS